MVKSLIPQPHNMARFKKALLLPSPSTSGLKRFKCPVKAILEKASLETCEKLKTGSGSDRVSTHMA